jgi:hypothetical protein
MVTNLSSPITDPASRDRPLGEGYRRSRNAGSEIPPTTFGRRRGDNSGQ